MVTKIRTCLDVTLPSLPQLIVVDPGADHGADGRLGWEEKRRRRRRGRGQGEMGGGGGKQLFSFLSLFSPPPVVIYPPALVSPPPHDPPRVSEEAPSWSHTSFDKLEHVPAIFPSARGNTSPLIGLRAQTYPHWHSLRLCCIAITCIFTDSFPLTAKFVDSKLRAGNKVCDVLLVTVFSND